MKTEQIPTPAEVVAEIRAHDAERLKIADSPPYIGQEAELEARRASRKPLFEKLKVALYAEKQRREAELQAELDAAIADRTRAEQPLGALRQTYEGAAEKYQAGLKTYESARDRIRYAGETLDRFQSRAGEVKLDVDEDPSVEYIRDEALIRECAATNLGINSKHGHAYPLQGATIYNNGSNACERLMYIQSDLKSKKDFSRLNRMADLMQRALAGG